MSERTGVPLRDGDRVGVRYARTLRHRPERVWAAVTESQHLAAWFPADLVGAREADAAVEFVFWPEVVERHSIPDPVTAGRILVWDPFSLFEFDWGGDVARFELSASGAGGTHLVLVVWLGPESLETGAHRAAAGYHTCLDALAAHLDGPGLSILDVDVSQLEHEYARLLT